MPALRLQYKFKSQIPGGINVGLFNSVSDIANCVDQSSSPATENSCKTDDCGATLAVVDKCLIKIGGLGSGEKA